jgi:hypothetical protein
MWIDVKYGTHLNVGDIIRVKHTGHEAVISRIVEYDQWGQELHCRTYHIEPRDPADGGGHWYFSHDFEKFNEE